MNILRSTILSLALLSSSAFSYVGESNPIIARGTVRAVENSEKMWVQFSEKEFEPIEFHTTPNNLRKEHHVALIKAYGVGNSMYKNSDSEMKQGFYEQSVKFANDFFLNQEVALYCTFEDTSGYLQCLIYREIENKLGEVDRISYNVGIIESGLSDAKFPFESDSDNPTKVEKALLVSKEKAKKSKLGIWSLKFNFLPDDF